VEHVSEKHKALALVYYVRGCCVSMFWLVGSCCHTREGTAGNAVVDNREGTLPAAGHTNGGAIRSPHN